jgi:hypothetical protein
MLVIDLPEQNLTQAQIGTVEHLEPESNFAELVKFADTEGKPTPSRRSSLSKCLFT